ncbi:MAG: hypothetical protein WDZ80_01170 [Candidatus Paceibacterota bacterium]
MSKSNFSILINSEKIKSLPVFLVDLDYIFNDFFEVPINIFILSSNNKLEIENTLNNLGKPFSEIKVIKNEEIRELENLNKTFIFFNENLQEKYLEDFFKKEKEINRAVFYRDDKIKIGRKITNFILKILKLNIKKSYLRLDKNILYFSNFSKEKFSLDDYNFSYLQSLKNKEKWFIFKLGESNKDKIYFFKKYILLWKDLIKLKLEKNE